MKIILKGIMTPEDAVLAVKYGADALVVSNHGGRQLDETSSTIEALPAIHAALATGSSKPRKKNKIPVLFDGGVRHGADIFKALALGADFVLIGRPVLWGLGYKGQEGVETVINVLERELSRTMALAGVTSVEGITREYIGVKNVGGFGVSKLWGGALVAEYLNFGMAMIDEIQVPHPSNLPEINDRRFWGHKTTSHPSHIIWTSYLHALLSMTTVEIMILVHSTNLLFAHFFLEYTTTPPFLSSGLQL
jgi:hypothetical protein